MEMTVDVAMIILSGSFSFYAAVVMASVSALPETDVDVAAAANSYSVLKADNKRDCQSFGNPFYYNTLQKYFGILTVKCCSSLLIVF